jgi:transposase
VTKLKGSAAKKKPESSAILAELRRLIEGGQHEQALEIVGHVLAQMATQNDELSWRLQTALSQLYRRKSEKISPEQLSLFLSKLTAEQAAQAEVELPDANSTPETTEPEAPAADEIKRKEPKAPHKKPFPPHLRREIRPIPVPPAECACSQCGGVREPIGYEAREIWEFKPGEFFVIEEQLEKRACKKCQQGVTTAPATPKPIECGRPGPGLLAQIVTAKMREAMPLYRQSQSYQRSGITLSTSTLGDWFAAAADLYLPVAAYARTSTLRRYLMSLDDTGLPVLDREDPRGIRRGHVWTYIGDYDDIAFCEYTPDWKKEGPCAVLSEFRGRVIQGDGYAGIDAAFEGDSPPIRAGCMDHCRRKFVKAVESGDARAAIAVAIIGKLYAVEAEARRDQVALEELRRRRDEISRPITNQLGRVIADLRNQAVPKSPLGKATIYAIRQWQTLMVYLDDPRVPISNAHVERQQRRTALMRKNSLFAGSDEGGKRIAVLETAVVNCDLADVPLFEYLRDVFQKIAAGWPQSRIAELMPRAWKASQPAA